MTVTPWSLSRLLASVGLARAYTLTALGVTFSAHAIESAASTVTLATMVAVLCVLGAWILFVRRAEITLLRFAPSSLLAFLLLALVSVFWTTDPLFTLHGWAALLGFAFLAVVIGHLRDTVQTVRAIGDTLRVLLAVSLGLEILSGILLDTPFVFLGIEGNIAFGGPIQGLFGTRNMLGFVAVIALITFVIEWRTRSVDPRLAGGSVALAGFLALFSASPTVLVLAVCVGAATAALSIVRDAPRRWRSRVQWMLGVVVVTALSAAFLLRHQIIRLLDAGSDFSERADLWNMSLDFIAIRPLHGWGWFGAWTQQDLPFRAINALLGRSHQSALNAYFDILLQLGAIGLVVFLLLGGIALVRSWLVASIRRPVIYAWTPLVLVTLAVDSMFESFTLMGVGWFLLVLCALRAGQSTSWRESIDAAHTGSLPTLPPQPRDEDSGR